MDQDQVVADFTTHITTTANTLVGELLAYHSNLSGLLFQIAELDDDHKAEIRTLSKVTLIKLRQRLESLTVTVRSATQAPDL